MSLINQALIDLQKRNAVDIDSVDIQAITVSQPGEQNALSTRTILLIGLVLVVVSFWVGQQLTLDFVTPSKSEKFLQSNSSEQRGPENTKEIPIALTDDLNPGVAEIFSESGTPLGAQEQKHDVIDNDLGTERPDEQLHYLAQANRAIAENRLSLPRENNALYYIRMVLSVDKENSDALSLLERARSSYLIQLVKAIDAKDTRRSKFLLTRFDNFDLPTDQKRYYLYKIDNIALAADNVVGVAEEGGNVTAVANRDKKEGENWFTKTVESQDQSATEKAKFSMRKGNLDSATEYLEEFIRRNPSAVQSTAFLFDHYVNTHRVGDAKRLQSNLPDNHTAFSYFTAKLLTLSNHNEQAIEILQATSPDARIASQHNGLLAGLLQKNERNGEARDLYKKLVRQFPENISFLLGYAITSDVSGSAGEALIAYERVANVGHSSTKVTEFVKARIEFLRPGQQMEASRW